MDPLSEPLIVATVTRPEDLEHLRSGAAPECDLLEYRFDNLLSVEKEAGEVMEAHPLPALLTVRHPKEGGAGGLSAESRLEIYRKHLAVATLVDVEVASSPRKFTPQDLASSDRFMTSTPSLERISSRKN